MVVRRAHYKDEDKREVLGINYVVNTLNFFQNYVASLNYVAFTTTKDVYAGNLARGNLSILYD